MNSGFNLLLRHVLQHKCAYKAIPVPTFESWYLITSLLRRCVGYAGAPAPRSFAAP